MIVGHQQHKHVPIYAISVITTLVASMNSDISRTLAGRCVLS